MNLPPAAPSALRVAFFAGNYNDVVDGVALTSNRQVRYLIEQNIPVRVYAPTAEKANFPHQGDLVSVPSLKIPTVPYRLALGLTSKILYDLNTFQPSLIHLATPDALGTSALRYALRNQIPVVSTFHTHFGSYLKYYNLQKLAPLAWRYLRWFYQRCDEVYLAAESMREELLSHGIKARYKILPFGVDQEHFSPALRSQVWRQRLQVSESEVVILFVGRLVWEKGLDLWARVIHRLESEAIPHRSIIVGEGPAGSKLQEMLPKTLFLGRLSGEALATAYASADIFLYPSASETFGCVTVEALASGLAVVAARATGSQDIIREGIDGILCEPESLEQFTLAVKELIDDPSKRHSFALRAVDRAATFSWPVVLKQMLHNFEQVLTHRGTARSTP